MRYIVMILMYLIATYSFLTLGFVNNGWQFVQPFLIITLLVYFNIENNWVYYIFAAICGLTVDVFSGVFGLHAIIFLTIIFILKNLQLSLLTSKNILTILLLTFLSWIMFWLMFWLINLIPSWELYTFSLIPWMYLLRGAAVNIFVVIFIHTLFYNFYLKRHGRESI
ncbi:hypothetical protein C0580_02155 [Candidatus Parcubacteria bacterium]|nr:MAG: hypothetical protein C0580_02155 [Candidatus Parcubacteria bacterium]